MPRLVALHGPSKDRPFDLAQDRVTVGRLPDNTVAFDDSTVSGHHAELLRAGKDYILRDLKTMNGTFLNGRRVEETHLCHGDRITFGNFEVEYLADARGPARATPSNLVNLSDTTPSAMPVMARERQPSTVHVKRKGGNRALRITLTLLLIAMAIALLYLAFKGAQQF